MHPNNWGAGAIRFWQDTFLTGAQFGLTTSAKNRSNRSAQHGKDSLLLPPQEAIDIEQLILAYIQ